MSKSDGVVCTFPNCYKRMQTTCFKAHFEAMHLVERKTYEKSHRDQYERAIHDPTLMDTASGVQVAIITFMKRVDARLSVIEHMITQQHAQPASTLVDNTGEPPQDTSFEPAIKDPQDASEEEKYEESTAAEVVSASPDPKHQKQALRLHRQLRSDANR